MRESKRLRLLLTASIVVFGTGFMPSSAVRVPAGISMSPAGTRPTIVLVHGAWADASSWRGVVDRLRSQGLEVRVPPNALRGPTADSISIASYLRTIPGPIVLVGHSYGGFVITNAALGNSAVKALVYIGAFIPDAGNNVLTLAPGSCLGGDPTKTFNSVPVVAAVDLYLQTVPNPPYVGIAECFATGLPAKEVGVIAATQRPIALNALAEPSGLPAWRTIPSWSLIGTSDRAIPPTEQQKMSRRANAQISTIDAGHLSLVSRPDAVTKIVLSAVNAVS
jgi:pimeloyl-ACP methyl ester carboxylesterase